MIGVCLQQLVFTTHNILEMSKIRQNKFKPNYKAMNLIERLNTIQNFFKDDMVYRQISYESDVQPLLEKIYLIGDESRFSIVLYNIFSNSIKHTTGGQVKVIAKLMTAEEFRDFDAQISNQKDYKKFTKRSLILNRQSMEEC